MSFTAGQTVGAYRIVEQLGSGGMATVYKAYHAALDRYVAIKVMHPAFKGDAGFLARFQREARVVARLEHPHIVPVYDYAEHEGSPYLVMRFVEGETLKARLQRGQLTLPEILDVARPMGEALTYAHAQGVLHRDIKPSNVLLTAEGKVFLTDFGLARIVQAGESSLTRDALVGTPYYISPEQAIGKSELDARTDIYSFGVVLYELLTGRVPFQSDTPFAVIHDHIYTPLPLPTAVNPNLPAALERVLLKAMAKEPADRYDSALDLAAAVQDAVTGAALAPPARPAPAAPPVSAPEPRPVSAKETPRNKKRGWVLALGGLAALAAAAVVAVLLLSGRGDEPSPATVVNNPPTQAPTGPAVEEPTPPLPPQAPLVHLEEARRLAAEGNVDGALAEYAETVAQDRHITEAYIEAAQLLAQRGDWDQAVEVLQRGLDVKPDHPELHLSLAQALIAGDNWDEAVGEIHWLLKNAPDMPAPHAYMSVYLSTQKDDLDGAQAEVDVAFKLDAELPEAHFAQGVLHWKAGRLRQARIALERAQQSPRASPFLKARVQFFLDRMDQAEPATSP